MPPRQGLKFTQLKKMKLQDFNYQLPAELIAQYPLPERDQARLMVVDRTRETIGHDIFERIGCYLPPESLVVVNDSKVIPARLWGRREKTGGQVEIFLLKKLADGDSYQCLIRPLKRLKIGEKIILNSNGIYATLRDVPNRVVQFNTTNIERHLNRLGSMPLPPYIKRPAEAQDQRFYQTVYARHPGSVAAPTAGLHFSKALLKELNAAGHPIISVTLHINHATFKPVQEEDITRHKMHSEDYHITQKAYRTLHNAHDRKLPIVAVGTTSCRVLETIARNQNLKGSTDIFIYPGYQFRMTDILVTNFHLPLSTLLMLVYAFGGMPLMKKVYVEAIKEKYRFYSYGDAMMII